MKKLMFTAAVAAGLIAFGDGLESQNTVGYSTKTLSANSWFIANAQFEVAGSTTASTTLNDLLATSATPGEYNTMEANAPQLQVLNSVGGYDAYYYITDAYDAGGNTVEGWSDSNGDLAALDLGIGIGFWYKAVSAATLTFAGQVNNSDTFTTSVAADQFKIIGNPFPIALDFSKMTTSLTPGQYNTMEANAPQLQVLNSVGGYDAYYYITDAYDAGGNTVQGWSDSNGDLATDPIEVGAGFWIKAPEAGTVTFAK